MRVTVAAADLAGALKNSVAARNSAMPIMQHALLTTGDNVLRMETSDAEIFVRQTIPAKVEEGGSICLVEALLRTIASASGEVLLRDDGTVQRGRSRFTVGAMPANDFPSPEAADFEPLDVDPVALREAIRLVDYAYVDGDIRPYVRALHMEPGRVWTTNGNQLGRATLKYSGPAARIPGAQIKRLVGALVEGARVSGGNIRNGHVGMLRVENDTTQVIVRCIDGHAPDISSVIPHLGKRTSVRANRKELTDAVRRMLPFLETATGGKGKASSAIKVTQSAEGLGVMNRHATSMEYVGIEPQEGAVPALELGLDAHYLLAALGAMNEENVELYLACDGACLFLPDGADVDQIAHVLMPCRLA